MNEHQKHKNLIGLLKEAVNTLCANPVILYPFMVIAFIQLLALQVLYFAPRFPLNVFFGPVIRRVWGEQFLHFPYHLQLVPKLFQYVQFPLYIFFSSFFVAMAVGIIYTINSNRTVVLKNAFKETLSAYVHIVMTAVTAFAAVFGLFKVYELVMLRAVMIRSDSGIYYIIKRIVLDGAPYFNLLIGVIVSAILAFVIPVIIIEKKKFFSALVLNFKHLWGSFWFILTVILLPTLLYIPILMLRNNITVIGEAPMVRMAALVLSVISIVFIDAVVYTAVTTYYLLKKEQVPAQ